ncbi:hypothetical protein IJ090_00855 [Candidatus Saccharibacteria bacterium]|nr:hypothetical protein [Candidatus Saccharibacteria bacterium]
MDGEYKGPVVVIAGPTGSGKTGVSIEIAKELTRERSASSEDALLTRRMSNTSRSGAPSSSHSISLESSCGSLGEIISADSRAIYKGMDIGTAKPTLEEREGITHYGFDLVEPGERFTAADWKDYAEQKICSIRERGKVPIVCGGTGLYIDALVYNYKFHNEYKNCSEKQGSKLSFAEKYPDRTEMSSDYIIFGIEWSREELRRRLKERLNKLFVQELFDETRRLVETYGWGSQAMKSDIYQFAWGYLEGKYSLERAKELCFHDDWHLARRQMTWFKRNPNIRWLPLAEIKSAALEIIRPYIIN